jgi:chromosomal replication initiator protein
METSYYAIRLEQKLIQEFKTKFREKIGYEPVVMTKVHMDVIQDNQVTHIPVLTLQELLEKFEPFLPEVYGYTFRLQSKSRKRELVDLRAMYCRIAKSMKYPLSQIGKVLGDRDHTTVIHALRMFDGQMKYNPAFKDQFNRILESIKIYPNESPDLDVLNQEPSESEPALLP